ARRGRHRGLRLAMAFTAATPASRATPARRATSAGRAASAGGPARGCVRVEMLVGDIEIAVGLRRHDWARTTKEHAHQQRAAGIGAVGNGAVVVKQDFRGIAGALDPYLGVATGAGLALDVIVIPDASLEVPIRADRWLVGEANRLRICR